MFLVARRILPVLPLASLLIGLIGLPAALILPPILTTAYVLRRDRLIRRKVGQAAWPSDGFARHVLVDDLAWMLCMTLLGLPLCLAGMALRGSHF